MLTTSFPVVRGASSGIFVERLAKQLGKKCDLSVLAPAADVQHDHLQQRSYKLLTFRYAPQKWQFLDHGGGGIPATLAARPGSYMLLPFFLFSMLFNTIWYARKANLIFANWSVCGVVAGIVGSLTGKAVFTTLRGEDANRLKSSIIHRLMIFLCLKSNKRIVTVSNDIAIKLSQQFPSMKDKIVMIPNGVDLISSTRVIDKKRNDKEIKLVMVGSLIPRKNIAIALSALNLLPTQFNLTIIGDGPEYSNLLSLSKKLHLESRVRFKGHIHPERIASYLSRSDVFLITSKSEGRPNSLLEACACGLPAVGSDIPGVREIIIPDVNGVLFPVGDHKALACQLLPLRNQSLRFRLGTGGRRLIRERGLTWENTAGKYIQQFQKFYV